MPDHLICLLRNLYAGQEATVRTRHGNTDWFKTGIGVHQAFMSSPCLFNLYVEHIIRNVGPDDYIKNLRHADDTTLTAENEEEQTSLLIKVKEKSEKAGLKLNIQKTKNMASCPITSYQIDEEKVETVTFYFLGLPIHCRW